MIPCVHFCITDGLTALVHEANLVRMAWTCIFYTLGTAVYVLRVPERYWPGKFDIWVNFDLL